MLNKLSVLLINAVIKHCGSIITKERLVCCYDNYNHYFHQNDTNCNNKNDNIFKLSI